MKTSIELVFNSEQKSKIWKDLSVGRPAGRPTQVPVTAPIHRSNLRAKPCQSVDRAVDRSSPAIDRAVDRYCLCTLVHNGRPGRSIGNCCRSILATLSSLLCLRLWLPYLCLWLPLSLLTILHLGEDFSNQSRTQHRICRLESGCTSVAAYVLCQGIKPSVVHPNELQQAHAIGRIWSNAL